MGPERGDHDQWIFKRVELTKLEKRLVVATVMKKAVLMLFQSHVYSFGGKFFLQRKGGPIGLRSTCSIARICMLDWDKKFLEMARRNGLSFAENMRYMDDLRVWMFGIRLGWRWVQGGLYYCSSWRDEELALGMEQSCRRRRLSSRYSCLKEPKKCRLS